MTLVDDTLAAATQLHQAGRLAEAERGYRQVLALEPEHPHALHQLGMLAMQMRQFETAVALISRAIRADRSQAAFHANLGECHRQLRQFDQAADCYHRAIKMQPEMPQIHTALGVMLQDQGRLDEAAPSLREALRLRPDDVLARTRLGQLLDAQNKFSEAEACFRRVLRTAGPTPEGHFNLASTLQSQQRLDEAIDEYEAALRLKPDYLDAHNNLGTILKGRGQWDAAAAHYRAAIGVRPDYVPAHANLGLLLEMQDRHAEAEACYRAAIASDPKSVLARHNLGSMLHKQGRLTEALAEHQEVVRLDPSYAAGHLSLGYVYQMQGRREAAIACCREALRLDPNLPEGYNNIAVAYAGDGFHDEAIAACRQALELRGDYSWTHSNLAVSLQAIGLLDEAIVHHRRALESDESSGQHSNLLYALNYHPAFSARQLFDEHVAWARRHADPLTALAAPHANDRARDRRLKVGYVSPHFRSHAVNFFTEPMLLAHDRGQFDVVYYSDTDEEDDVTRRLRAGAHRWRDTRGQSDEAVSQFVRQDQIDILVDLTGHINGGKRMLLFARKAAPIQVTYIGYQNTTGMQAMDYRLTDDYSDPPGATERWHTEKLVRLPRTFFVYQPTDNAPPVGDLPASANGYVTFGSINNFTKCTPEVLDAWAELLRRVPGSKLVIRADMTPSLAARLMEFYAERGVATDRLELVHRLPRPRYLELISRLDIALDPFPFNGHTTTCDCLWQGVPVVTLSGDTYVSRFGGSGLATLGLHDLITASRAAYIDAAAALAGDLARLQTYRATLRARMADSPLSDFATFTRNLEAAYRQMWHDWLAAEH